jgi:hypothetical protein
MECGQNVNFGF